MTQIKLLVDNREHQKVQELINTSARFKKIPVEYKNLPVGDYIYTAGETPLFIIERKSISDLASSITSKSGRYREQKHRLCNDTKLHRCRIMYLIEGYHHVKDASIIHGLPKDTILSSFVNTIARDRLHVYHTSDINETVVFLAKLYHAIVKHVPVDQTLVTGGSAEQSEDRYLDIAKLPAKKDKLTPEIVYQLQLSLFPGVSRNAAREISKVFPNFPKLITASEKDLADIKIAGRRFGNIRSKRILKHLQSNTIDST